MSIMKRMDLWFIGVQSRLKRFLEEERGDTNFISILVLLGIALALAAIFLAFKDQVLEWVDRNVEAFFRSSGGR